MKHLFSAPHDDANIRSIYLETGPDRTDPISSAPERESNPNYATEREEGIAAAKQKSSAELYEEKVSDQEIDEAYDEGETLSQRTFTSKEEAMKALTEAGIGNVRFVSINNEGQLNEMSARDDILTGDLSLLDSVQYWPVCPIRQVFQELDRQIVIYHN